MSNTSLKSICIYVHWNKQNLITDADLYTIKLLSEQVDEILVIQNVDDANKNFDEIKLPTNATLVTRPNFGYDFGGYKFGVDLIKKRRDSLEELYLCNNSIFTVVDNFNDLFQKLRASKFSVCGLTDSNEREWHLQSYFLRFDQVALQSKVFDTWWNQLNPSDEKNKTVSDFEVPLAGYFAENEFSVGAIWPINLLTKSFLTPFGMSYLNNRNPRNGYKNLLKRIAAGMALNPTHKYWSILLDLGFPFIKKDLLTGRVHDDLGQKFWSTAIDCKTARSLIAAEI